MRQSNYRTGCVVETDRGRNGPIRRKQGTRKEESKAKLGVARVREKPVQQSIIASRQEERRKHCAISVSKEARP